MDPAPAETATGDLANRSPPDVKNNEQMPVQEHADADDLYQDISAPNGEEALKGNPNSSNGKHASRECDEERGPSQAREQSREPNADRRERSSKERSRSRHKDERGDKDRDTERPRERGRSERGKSRDRDRDGHRDRDRDRDRDRRSHRDGDDREHRSHRRHRDDRTRSRGDERSEPRSRDEYRSHGGSDRDRDRHRDRDRDRGRDSRYDDRDRDDRDSRYGNRYSDRRERSHDRDWESDRRRYDDKEPSRRDYDRRQDEGQESRGRGKEERKPDLVLGGYKPRQRSSGAIVPQAMDPFAAVRAKNKAQGLQVNNPLEVEKARNEQQAKARQMVLQQQAISTAAAASKTQREVYIGNLQQGKVTEQTLRQLFDEALSTTFPHLLTPGVRPCLSVAMHSEGRYAFVELATPEMATAALQLSGQLNFLGSQMTVGRPSGYIDPAKAAAAAAAASKALQEFTSDVGEVLAVGEAPPAAPDPTQCLCIDHMVGVSVFTDEEEYQELVEDLHEECSKHGTVVDTRIPCPDKSADLENIIGTGCYGKVYCLMDTTESAIHIQSAFNGRVYDGRKLHVSYIQPAHFYMLPVPIPMQPEGFP